MKTIFGPILSRRFGKSLGIDLSPTKKQCNFDCLYCELSPTKSIDRYDLVIEPDIIIKELKEALAKHKDIDVLTVTANGEPTLYPYLEDLIKEINSFKGDIKSLILTNSSTIDKKETQEALGLFDTVKLSLDCATNRCFKRLDRPHKSIDLESIKRGMLEFRDTFKGSLIIEVLVVEGINDKEQEIKEINNFLLKLRPSRIDLGTIDRPPAYNVKGVDYSRLYRLSHLFDSSLFVNIVSRKSIDKSSLYSYTKEDIINTISKRPLTIEDAKVLFDSDTLRELEELYQNKTLNIVEVGGVEFYKLNSSNN